MAVNYNVADTKIISNETSASQGTKIRFKFRHILAKLKGPYEETSLGTARAKYNDFLKEYEENLTDGLKKSLLGFYEKKVSAITTHLERKKVQIFSIFRDCYFYYHFLDQHLSYESIQVKKRKYPSEIHISSILCLILYPTFEVDAR